MYYMLMNDKKELYRGLVNKELRYTHASSTQQALLHIKQKCKKLFGIYKISDLERQLVNKSWTRVPF